MRIKQDIHKEKNREIERGGRGRDSEKLKVMGWGKIVKKEDRIKKRVGKRGKKKKIEKKNRQLKKAKRKIWRKDGNKDERESDEKSRKRKKYIFIEGATNL